MTLSRAGRADTTTKVMSTILQLATEITASAQPNHCLGLHCAQTPGGWTSPSLNATISSPAPPKPVRFIFNTSIDADHTGGNQKLGELPADSKIVGVTFPPVGVVPSAEIIAYETVLQRMSDARLPAYERVADITVDVAPDPQVTCDLVMQALRSRE